MPTQKYFNMYPAFPSDVLTAQLPRLSLSKLLDNDDTESDALFKACRSMGFFLLDFQGCTEGETFLKLAEKMFDVNEEVNAMDVEELMKHVYQPPHSLFGFKPIGHIKIEDGSPDRLQFYNIGQDDILGTSKRFSNPPCIEANRPEIKKYMEQAHALVSLICSHLDKQLQLSPGTLISMQPTNRPSGTSLRMLQYPPQPPNDQRTSLLGHTDIGTLTILFNITGGLQLLDPTFDDPKDDSNWKYVEPVPGCAIVNIGDAVVEWSGGILRSNMHRVTFAPGEQGKVPRHSLAYLVRPDGDVPMKRLSGGGTLIPRLQVGEAENEMTAKEWERAKSISIMSGRDSARSRGGREILVGQ